MSRSIKGAGRTPRQKILAVMTSLALVVGMTVLFTGPSFAQPSKFMEGNGADGNIKDGGLPNPPYDWANSGTCNFSSTTGATETCLGAGGAFNGGIFNGKTTPPTPPQPQSMADGTIPPSGQGFEADPLSTDKTACGSGDPTAYTGAGSETNNSDLNAETYNTASIPNKDDLENAYAVAHIRTDSDGHTEVYFGTERIINNGDSHVDFEFLQNNVTVPTPCSGTLQGHHAQGDLLITTDFTGGGTSANPKVYKWICRTTINAADDGKICDPGPTGPNYGGVPGATVTGYSPHYELQTTVNPSDFPNSVNQAPISCGGWVCRDTKGNLVTTLDTNEFFEGSLDLTELGFTQCLHTFMPHTRSSQSFTAVLKDFAKPIPFNTCAPPTVATQVKDSTGTTNTSQISLGQSVTDFAHLTGTLGPVNGTVDFFACGPTAGLDTTGCLANDPTRVSVPAQKTLVNGDATSDTFTPTATGRYCFGVQYTHASGSPYLDTYFDGHVASGTSTECFNVIQETATVQTTPQQGGLPISGTVNIGTSVVDYAKVTGTTVGGSPTGTLNFFVCDPTQTSGSAGSETCPDPNGSSAGSKTLSAISGSNPPATEATSDPVTVNKLGVWCFRGVYVPDTGAYATGAHDNVHTECFNVTQETATVQTTPQQPPGTAIIGSVNKGSNVVDYARVTGTTKGGDPTGTVNFFVCNPTQTSGGAGSETCPDPNGSSAGSKTLTDISGSSPPATEATSDPVTVNQTGVWCFRAVYVPTAGIPYAQGSNDSSHTECFLVTQETATVQTTPQQPPGTAITGSVNKGSSVVDYAKVTGTSKGGSPTGTLNFFVCDPTQIVDLVPGDDTTATCPDPNGSTAGSKTLTAISGSNPPATEATSDPVTVNQTGVWCFRGVYVPDVSAYASGAHDNSHTECFTVTQETATVKTTPQEPAGSDITAAVALGSTDVADHAVVTGTSKGGSPTGAVNFFICDPTQVTGAAGAEVCNGGTAVTGNPVTLIDISGSNPPARSATSGSVTVNKLGVWCFRAIYVPDNSIYAAGANDSTHGECFTVRTTSSATTLQNWLPNDHVTISTAGGVAMNGSLDIKLYKGTLDKSISCAANVSAAGAAKYTEPTITLNNTASGTSFDTSNQSFLVKAANAGDYFWVVTFSPSAGSFIDGFTSCVEASTVSPITDS